MTGAALVSPWYGLVRVRQGKQVTVGCRLGPLPAVLLLLSFGSIPGAGTAFAAPPAKTLALSYEVYAGGLHIFSFDVDLRLEPQGYRITAAGNTRGMTAMLYKWQVRLAAEGRNGAAFPKREAENLRPLHYVTVNATRSGDKTMRLEFDPKGSFSVVREPAEPQDERETELPANLPPDIADPLSAGLIATETLARTGRCEQTIPVFDGKRRYNLLMHDQGQGEVPKTHYSVYHGPATRCGFTMQRISGFKKQRRYAAQWDEDKDEPPVIWVAKVRDDLPPIPVRATAAVALGSIVVHLTRVEPGPEVASVSPP